MTKYKIITSTRTSPSLKWDPRLTDTHEKFTEIHSKDVIGLDLEWEKKGISESFSAETYIQNTLPKVAKSCGIIEF